MREILADLVAEQQSLDQFLQGLRERDWDVPTVAPGWDVRAVISHLAYTDHLGARAVSEGPGVIEAEAVTDIDEWTQRAVILGKDKRYQEVIEWWRSGRAALVDALSRVDKSDRVAWILGQMSARSFATTRLMEVWAHGLDIKGAFDIVIPEDEPDPFEDTPRLRHVAWLGHRMLPHAFDLAGEEYPEQGIRIELIGPGYQRWVYGPESTDQIIKGVAGEWCRVAVRRVAAADTGLKASGEYAEKALVIAKAY